MKKTKLMGVMAAAVLLTGCAGIFGQYDIDALNGATPAGDKFTSALTAEYRDLANSEWSQSDWKDGEHFAEKGLAAASGEAILPDEPASRDLPDETVADITDGYGRLMEHLEASRDHKPLVAAKAQAAYDCWIEQQEENHQPEDIAACRKSFEEAVGKLGARYIVFFETGSAKLSKAASKIISQAVKEARKGGFRNYFVIGHTDTQGKPGFNENLSKQRAAAVKSALIARGVPAKKIKTSGKGETKPMVTTQDGVKEPSNRRVEIIVQ